MKTTLRNILIIFGILVLLAALWYFRNIVIYILVSGVLSIMGRPLVVLLTRIRIGKWSFPRIPAALLTLIVILGMIALFFITFVPLVTKQINYLSTIDSEKIVQFIENPITRLERIFTNLNPEISNKLSIKAYLESKVSGILNIEMIQNLVGEFHI